MVPVLVLGKGGVVERGNSAATELLGECTARPCRDLVLATEPSGAPICTKDCAAALIGEVACQRDRPALVRDEAFRMVCTSVGDHAVVTLLPAQHGEARPTESLSARENEVLDLVAKGLTTAAIAERLGIGKSTVRTHVEKARAKLGARTRAEAIARRG